ncbi:MAG: secretin N-terminal domain-containing protein [Comamonadaceae bacterium]|nr:secretin N-terminal domain-containing protein [Comamonadaceae bacterium]
MPAEPRFDLIVNSAPARDVFLAMVTDTRYSMLMHPEVDGHDLGDAARRDGARGAGVDPRRLRLRLPRSTAAASRVYPPTMQTRIFTVNYLNAKRQGRSEVRVSGSGCAGDQHRQAATGGQPAPRRRPRRAAGAREQPHRHQHSPADFWAETTEALRSHASATAEGRSVIASPQSGTIAVRAMPDELRQVEAFLQRRRALPIERQVMLEAKIVEVELRDGFADRRQLGRASAASTATRAGQPAAARAGTAAAAPTGSPAQQTAASLLVASASLAASRPAAACYGLALQTKQLRRRVLDFLETQGDAAGAVEPAHGHAEQPEGGAQGRHRRVSSSPTSRRHHHAPPAAGTDHDARRR